MNDKTSSASGKTPSMSQVETTEVVLPPHTNAIGTLFGGELMSWIDKSAAMAAVRHTRKVCVTASVDSMHFLAPIQLGWFVILKASVNYVGQTSLEVGVRVESENPLSGERFHATTAFLTMVAFERDGKKTCEIPPLLPQTEDEWKRYKRAEKRRKERLDERKRVEHSGN